VPVVVRKPEYFTTIATIGNHPALQAPLQKRGMGNDQYFSFNLCTRWREDSMICVLIGEIRVIRGWIK